MDKISDIGFSFFFSFVINLFSFSIHSVNLLLLLLLISAAELQAACRVPLFLKISGMLFWNRTIALQIGRGKKVLLMCVLVCVCLHLALCGVDDLSLPSLFVVFRGS